MPHERSSDHVVNPSPQRRGDRAPQTVAGLTRAEARALRRSAPLTSRELLETARAGGEASRRGARKLG